MERSWGPDLPLTPEVGFKAFHTLPHPNSAKTDGQAPAHLTKTALPAQVPPLLGSHLEAAILCCGLINLSTEPLHCGVTLWQLSCSWKAWEPFHQL